MENIKDTTKTCPKNKKNSACSGVFEGKCEVFNTQNCIFYTSYIKNNSDIKNFKNSDIKK